MRDRRVASRATLFVAAAVVAAPNVTQGQGIPGIKIDSAQFIVTTRGLDGQQVSRQTNRVPLDPYACYGWRLHFSTGTRGELDWREEFQLPAPGVWPPSPNYERRQNAIDALRDFVKEQARRGSFGIRDTRLEHSFWSYFVNDSLHDFLPVTWPQGRSTAPGGTTRVPHQRVVASRLLPRRCWGQNDRGQLGDGTRTSRSRPMRVVQ